MPGAASRIDVAEQGRLVVHLLRWVALGTVIGVLAGVSSWALLKTLEWATRTRLENPWLLFLLPVAGFIIGWIYYRLAGRSIAGSNLLLDEIHTPTEWIPRRMAFLVYAATVVTQLFGGSGGSRGHRAADVGEPDRLVLEPDRARGRGQPAAGRKRSRPRVGALWRFDFVLARRRIAAALPEGRARRDNEAQQERRNLNCACAADPHWPHPLPS